MEEHEKTERKVEAAQIRQKISSANERGRAEGSIDAIPTQNTSHQNDETKRPLHEDSYAGTDNEARSSKRGTIISTTTRKSASTADRDNSNKRFKSSNSDDDTLPPTPTTISVTQLSSTSNNANEYSTKTPVRKSGANYSIVKDHGSTNQPPPTPPPSAASTATNTSSIVPSDSATPIVDANEEKSESTTKADDTTTAISQRKTSVSSFDAGNGWTDDDAYESMPKTPVAPPQSSSTRKNLRQHTMSPIPSASAVFLPDVPPAPPTTPAARANNSLPFQVDLGLATPLPYTAGFVQNANQLEQQQRQTQKNIEQQQQKQRYDHEQQQQQQRHHQQELHEGAVTPAPHRSEQQQEQSSATNPPSTISTTALSDDFSEWAVGDRYKLSRMLGRGSYGEVAQAVDLYQGRPDAYVAIKRIVGPFDQEVDAVRLFREIHILRRLRTLGKNDCIVPLLDVVQPPTDDLNDFHDLYLVFDYVDTDLYKLIMSPQYLTTEHIQTFLYQMLIGLKYIHSGNVIHRDLKPANILLNEDCSLKICDFGLARIVDETSVARGSVSRKISENGGAEDFVSGRYSSPKKFLGRSCSISEQTLTHDEVKDFKAVSKLPLTRQLTKHVVTRWYRAPELILIQPYTTAVDVWSLGCIFAELLSMQEGSVPGYQDRTPLFPGGACYPLSGDTDNAERLDQLNVIFNVIGTPTKEEIANIGGANEYVKTMKPIKPKNLRDIYPAADSNALDLLQKMLKFNPNERCTASEALNHQFFVGIRREEMETTVEAPMESPAFLNEQEIDIETLKQKTFNEVLWFRDNQSKEILETVPTGQTTTETHA